MFKVYDKYDNNQYAEPIRVYSVIKHQNQLCFLMYKNNDWTWEMAKYYAPVQ
jgi:hypothetical protein